MIPHLEQAVSTALTTLALPLSRWSRQRLIFLLVGILTADSIVLRRIATAHALVRCDSPHAASHERRLRRLSTDPQLTWATTYAPALRTIITWPTTGWVRVIIDESGHTDRVRGLMAAVWYRGRALPLAWLQWPAQTPQTVSYWERCRDLLALVAQILPPTLRVIISADRAFGHPTFTDLVVAHGWEWVVRVQRQTCFCDVQGGQRTLTTVVPTPGQRWKGRGSVFKKAGWRPASVVAYWSTRHRESLVVVSSLPLGWDILHEYQRRGAIETLFRDWKSAGWDWEASQVRDLAQHGILLLGMAWASLVVLCEGTQVADACLAQPVRERVSRTWDGKHSLVRLGRDRIRARTYGTVTTPLVWQLRAWHAPTWQRECRQHHAPRGARGPTATPRQT
jgi:hypothetical protein